MRGYTPLPPPDPIDPVQKAKAERALLEERLSRRGGWLGPWAERAIVWLVLAVVGAGLFYYGWRLL